MGTITLSSRKLRNQTRQTRPAVLLTLCSARFAHSMSTAAPSWPLQTAISTISALERNSGSQPLDLLSDLWHPESGLCSEGTWHNSMLGIGRVLAAREVQSSNPAHAAVLQASAAKLGDSLFELNFDGSGFRKRSSSGIWQSAADADMASAIEKAGENVAFYLPSTEHRCISSAAAVIFYSMLAEETGDELALARAAQVGDCFVELFDPASCRFRRTSTCSYFRAVDQAVGCLAALRLVRLGHQVDANRAMASCAADSLLREFGYSRYATERQPPVTYLGREAARNSWHDSLVCFALVACGCLGVGGESLEGLLKAMVDDYRNPDGQMRHQPRELCSADGVADAMQAAVVYSSTQALWSAVMRAAGRQPGKKLSGKQSDVAPDAEAQVRAYYEAHVLPETGLLPVANLYHDARLWANTEWAAWLVIQASDFEIRRAVNAVGPT